MNWRHFHLMRRATLAHIARVMLKVDVFRFEIFLVASSTYAALQLLFWPTYIWLCTKDHVHLSRFAGIRYLGAFLLLGSILTAAGVAIRMTNRRIKLSSQLRMSAMVVHGFFWLVSGISLILDSWHTPTAGMLLATGAWAPWLIWKIAFIEPRSHH
jgi:hypothetical protein